MSRHLTRRCSVRGLDASCFPWRSIRAPELGRYVNIWIYENGCIYNIYRLVILGSWSRIIPGSNSDKTSIGKRDKRWKNSCLE